MTDNTTTNISGIVAEVKSARRRYQQVIQNVYSNLMTAFFDASNKEYEAQTEAMEDDHSIHDDRAEEWLHRFDQAQEAARRLVELIPMLGEIGMPVCYSRTEELVSFYAFYPALGHVPIAVASEEMQGQLEVRLMGGTGEPDSRDLDDLEGDHRAFMLVCEQPFLSDRAIWNT